MHHHAEGESTTAAGGIDDGISSRTLSCTRQEDASLVPNSLINISRVLSSQPDAHGAAPRKGPFFAPTKPVCAEESHSFRAVP